MLSGVCFYVHRRGKKKKEETNGRHIPELDREKEREVPFFSLRPERERERDGAWSICDRWGPF